MRRILTLFLAALLAISIAGGARAEVVTDMMGDEVALPESRERVVSLSPAMTEIIFALGLGDRLVGVDSYSDYPPEAAGMPVAGDYSGPNLELIISLQPDIVFASNKLQADAIAQMNALGISVLAMEPTGYAGIYDCIELTALVLEADAGELLDGMKARQAAVEAAAAGIADSKKVYYALSFGEFGDWSAGPGTFVHDMIVMAGGINVAQDAPYPWIMYTLEQIAADDPDVIIVGTYGFPGVADELAATPGYDGLRAVAQGMVFEVNGDAISRPGPRIVEALEAISGILLSLEG